MHDLYSVVLHEVIHLLGVASFIDVEPFSSNNIYTRYDEHLYIGSNQVIGSLDCYTTTGALSPTSFESTCGTVEVSFIGDDADEPVFSSTSAGSHLSHFQSDCPSNGNLHYVMSPSLGVDQTYRLPLQEEVYVLCNLGYQTSGTYGTDPSLAGLNYKSDYNNCSNVLVAGVDDVFNVLDDQSYDYTAVNFIGNDINATKVTCMESLGGITVTESAGIYTVNVPFTIGIGYYALRYIPEDNFGNKGNTTYVFFTVDGSGELCDIPDLNEPCNLLCGGDFEVDGTGAYHQWRIDGNQGYTNWVNSFDLYPAPVFSGETTAHFISTDGLGGESNMKREGFSLPFKTPLSIGETYTVKLHARLTTSSQEINSIYFLTSTSLPCQRDSEIYNYVDVDGVGIPETPCLDGTTFDPSEVGNILVDEIFWEEFEFEFTPTESVEYFTFFIKEFIDTRIFIDAVSVTGPIVGNLDVGENQQRCADSEGVTLGAPGLGDFVDNPIYLWEPSTGLSANDVAFPVASPDETTTYQLTISSEDCDYTYSGEVTVSIIDCCEIYANELDFSGKTASLVLAEYSSELVGGSFDGETIKINNEFTVNTDIGFLNCTFELGDNARIDFADGLSATTELNIRSSILKACDDNMWDGVILSDENHHLSLSNSTLRDAKKGIDISGCASYNIGLNTFRSNLRDINVYDCATGIYNLSNNDFYSENLLAPYLGEQAEYSVTVEGISSFTMTYNDLFNYDKPIEFRNTDIVFKNNIITHITEGTAAVGMLFTDEPHELTTEDNEITNYKTGIANHIDYVFSNKGITFNMTGDAFENNFRSINFRNAISRYSSINNGTFTNVSYGIVVQGTLPSTPTSSPAPFIDPARKITIRNNTMTGVRRIGIWTTNLTGSYAEPIGLENKIPRILDNNITLKDYFGGRQQGIRADNCFRIRVQDNTVSSPGVFPAGHEHKVKGITIADCRRANVEGNTLKDLGEGFFVVGLNNFTQWECNEINKCYNGFHFYDAFGAATYITQQGGSNNPTDNKWISMNNENAVGALIVPAGEDPLPKWYYRPGGIYDPDLNLITETYFDPTLTSSSLPLCEPSGSSWENLPKLEEMVDESISYPKLNDEFKYLDKDYVYRAMLGKAELQGESLVLDNFFDLMEDSGIGRQVNITRDIRLGDLPTAIQRNSNWITENLHEANAKTVNAIYLRSVAVGVAINSVDEQTLLDIALTTPYLGGNAVYSARVLLGIDPTDDAIYYRQAASQDINQAVVNIYPNPSTGRITIRSNETSEKSRSFNCYDVTGKLLLNKDLLGENVEFDLSHLPAGIYIIQIHASDGHTILQDRLMLTK